MSDNTKADLRAASMLVGDILAESEDEAIAQRVREEQARRQEERAQRHARGWFLVAELVEMHARQRGWTAEMETDAHRAARMAAGDGSLPVREFPEGFPEPAASTLRWCELSDFNDWLRRRKVKLLTLPQGTPSASTPAAPLPVPVAPPAAAVLVSAGSRRAPTVQEVIAPYVAKLMRERPNYTAEELHRLMRRDAGGDNSPFSRLISGSDLFCTEVGKSCGIATVRAAVTAYRKTLSSTVEAPSNP